MDKRIQAKHIDESVVLGIIDDMKATHGRWTHVRDLEERLGLPERVIRAKLRSMINRGVIEGCACGCRGDLVRPGDL